VSRLQQMSQVFVRNCGPEEENKIIMMAINILIYSKCKTFNIGFLCIITIKSVV